jgi:hypothetical protein
MDASAVPIPQFSAISLNNMMRGDQAAGLRVEFRNGKKIIVMWERSSA